MKLIELGKSAKIISGFAFKSESFTDNGIPVIKISNIGLGDMRIEESNTQYVDSDYLDKLDEKFKVSFGDVLISLTGSHITQPNSVVGRVSLYKESYISLLNQRAGKVINIDKKVFNKRFLFYILNSASVRTTIALMAHGAASQANVSPKDVERIKLLVPTVENQKKIAAILSTYDDLIENNKKRIQILENMAEELYKEWFVRFRFPNWENTEFEKGIPKNWEIKGFSELVSINPKESLDKNETYRFVGMEYLSTDSSFFYSDEYRLGNAGSKFRNGDILFPRITPCVENGKKGLVSTLKENEVACGSTEFIVFREKVLPKEYIYLLCKQSGFRQHAEQSMIGASGRQRITLNCFNKFYLPLPNNEILKEFTKHTKNYFHLIMELHMKNRKLAEVRDSLLPRLISGKLSVENLDIQFPISMQEK
ncbi:TPA: restriction endonuclease subunit S [Acinetobacter baumannii]|nr:restriction endonuclease subunit S [Acinetobacter baumannii]